MSRWARPHYMAPEQFESAKSVDHRADIYSMGVLFYEMLTGELPLGRFAPPSHKRVEVDVRLDEIVLRALDKDPAKRYQSMAEVGRAVTQITGISPAQRPEVSSGQTKLMFAIGGVILAAGLAWLAYQFNQSRQTSPSQSSGVDYQKLYEEEKKKQIELLAAEAKKTEAAKADPWTVAKLDACRHAGRLAGGRHDRSHRTRRSSQILELDSRRKRKRIEKVRKLVFNGPNDYSVRVFIYQCRTAQVLDKCVDILHEKVLGLPNHFEIDKDNTLVYGLAFQE